MKKPLNSMANIAERIVLYVHYLIESVSYTHLTLPTN